MCVSVQQSINLLFPAELELKLGVVQKQLEDVQAEPSGKGGCSPLS